MQVETKSLVSREVVVKLVSNAKHLTRVLIPTHPATHHKLFHMKEMQ